MKNVEYTNYCVAFLDILGFKNLIGTESASVIHNVFDNIRRGKKLIHQNCTGDTHWERLRKTTKFYFFSDSIVCAIPMEEPQALELVSSHCMLLQHALWYYGLPVWLRGGIACGDLFCGQSEVFGPALIEAYTIESTQAKFPRIIMSEATYQYGLANSADEDIIFVTKEDDVRMVEIFKYFNYEPERERVIRSIQTTLKSETNPRVLEKYEWIKARYDLPV